jgi:hypothetical protein
MHNIKALRVTMPPKRLTDPSFNYRRACDTNIAETINNERARIKQARQMPVIYRGQR